MARRLIRYVSFWCFVLALPLYVLAFSSPGNPTGYVNDFASVLTAEQKNILENKLKLFNASTTNEIAVVIVKSLDGDYVEHYAEQLFKVWQIGTVKNDNGVLLLIATDDRKMRVEVGYGLEGVLTDAVASSIIRNDLTPAFKENDFFGGIDKATDDIIAVTKGEYVADQKEEKSDGGGFSLESIFIIFVIAVQFLGAILARSKSWWLGGVLGGILGGLLTAIGFLGITVVIGSIMTVVMVLLGLLFDYVVSSSYSSAISRGSSVPWWAGGRGFGSGSSSSSFGGFGGGSSGGGGASGSW